jgi:hypothetical protein
LALVITGKAAKMVEVLVQRPVLYAERLWQRIIRLAMATHSVFYSWQADLPNSTNRGFIQDCLERALDQLRSEEDLKLDPCLDRDTAGVPGSPDIAATIFQKIMDADVFVADVSFINREAAGRRTPNPNVLVELGYAARSLGWGRVVCVFNKTTGSLVDLPFDIRQRRILPYELAEDQEKAEQKKKLASTLADSIRSILHAPDESEAEALQGFLTHLSAELIEVILLGDQFNDRNLDPWLSALRARFQISASNLRQLAADDVAIRQVMAPEIEELAGVLEDAANLRIFNTGWPEFSELVTRAVATATTIKSRHIDGTTLSDEALQQLWSVLATSQRQLEGLASRTDKMVSQGHIEDVQREVSNLGATILRLGHYWKGHEAIRSIGRDLHLIETIRIAGGGRSVATIVERVKQNAAAFSELVEKLRQCSS